MSQQETSDRKLLESAKFSVIDKENIIINRSEGLGRGAYGTVYGALYDGKPCVVKEMHPFLQSVKHKHAPVELIFEEINTLSSLRHPNIVQFLGVYFVQENFATDSQIPLLVMERMWKNLSGLLEQHPKHLSLIIKVHILHDVICGLRYLHNKKKPIFHRDLNANNILLTENLLAKIGDLGQARALELFNENTQLSTAPGNPLHMPPEALVPKPYYDSSLDIFSFGCIIIHTVTEKFPIPTDQFVQAGNVNMYVKQPEAQRRQEYLDLMDDYQVLQTIAIQCLEDTPTSRPSACHICDNLLQYIKKLETEFPVLTAQHKQDKLSLIHSNEEASKEMKSKHEKVIKEKDEYTSMLELQLQESRGKLEQDRDIFEKEKNSLEMELAKQNEMNSELSRIYQDQVHEVREELEASSLACIQLQQQIDDLQTKLKYEKSEHLQKITDLQGEIKLAEDKNQTDRLAFHHDRESLHKRVCEQETINKQLALDNKLLKDKLSTEVTNNVAMQEMNLNIEHERELLRKKLKEQENEFINNQIQMDELRTHKEQLQEMYCKCEQERDVLQKKLDEQQIDHQILVDGLKEDAKKDLNEANRQIQRLQNKLKCKTADLEVLQNNEKITDPGSQLHLKILEIHSTHRNERSSFLATIDLQKENIAKLQAQLSNLEKKYLTQKRHLEEKSFHLSTLESSIGEFQGSSYAKDEKLKILNEENAILKKQLDNNDRIQRNFEKNLNSKEESLKRKEQELELQKKEHADEINNLHDRYKREINDLREDIERYKAQIDSQGEISSLLKKGAEYKSDLEKSTKDRLQKLDNEQKSLSRSEKELKRLIKYRDADIKEKTIKIESLEKDYLNGHSHGYNYDMHWYPYLSLPTKLIRPSVAVITDKAFVTGGYQSTNPQDKELKDYLQTLEDKSSTFSFNLAKYQCDTMDSPVKLGALASVNGQCVLVSGADSVGNTLTGNVYVLCEEGSHDQWKEFSKPLQTPRILACACCYVNRWLIVCGGFASKSKEESGLLKAVSVVEILDTTKGEWYTLSEENCPNFSTILCCAVVGEDVHVVGSDQVIKTSCNNLIKAATSNNTLVWDNVPIESEESNGKLYPFSVVEVTGEPMIIASMTDGEDDATCVLMKDTRGRWRIMSKAVECQHCSAAMVTSSLELLLFGGSEKVLVNEATDTTSKSSLIPTLNIYDAVSLSKIPTKPLTSKSIPVQSSVSPDFHIPVTAHQPSNLSFTGPIHTIQFDHNGGTFQSPIHKVSLVVPPNALSDGEKVTVYMGATTSGPFDLPEDCKLRSAVVWLSVSPSDVVFKRSISVIVPHSAVINSSQHHSMMRFVICEDSKGPRYKFSCSSKEAEIDAEQGAIELNEFAMVAIIASPEFSHDQKDDGVGGDGFDSDDDFHDAPENMDSCGISDVVATEDAYQHQSNLPVQKKLELPPARYLAKTFWPRGELPSSFRVDIYYVQKLPTELYKVDIVYKKQYYEENGAYPEIMDTEFGLHTDEVNCVLPCHGSSKCDCLRYWDVIQMTDTNEIQRNPFQQNNSQSKLSFKFTCYYSGAPLTCCFEFQGAKRLRKTAAVNLVPLCLQKRFTDYDTPFIVERGIHCRQSAVPMKAPVEKTHAFEVVHDKLTVSNGEGVITKSPPLKNLL